MGRGQLTLFVIIGLVAVILFAFMFAVKASFEERVGDEEKIDFVGFDEAEGILRTSVASCISTVAQDAIYAMGSHAGYIDSEPNVVYGETGAPDFMIVDGVEIPVVADESGMSMLSADDLKERICSKVYVDLGSCIDTAFFEEAGYGVLQDEWIQDFTLAASSCESSLRDGSVAVKITHPIVLLRDGYMVNVSEFVGLASIDLAGAHGLAVKIANASYQAYVNGTLANSSIVLNLSSMCEQVPVNYEVMSLDGGRVVRIVESDASYPFLFQFAFDGPSAAGECI